jgi:hypothetical protein
MKYSELKKFVIKLRGLGFKKVHGQNCWRITFRFTDNAEAHLMYTFEELYCTHIPLEVMLEIDLQLLQRHFDAGDYLPKH